VKSEQPGAGGYALAALYCIAKDLGLHQISYFVQPHNESARRFYLQLDFGEPMDEELCKWMVKL